MKSIRNLCIITTLMFAPVAIAKDRNEQLTDEEKEMVGYYYAKVRHMPDVKKAREAHEAAVRDYHEVLRKAMIAEKPEIEPALDKIRINPGLLADAIWQRRNREFLNTLNYPLGRLSKEERDVWDYGMKKLQSSPTTDAFSKGLEANRQRQAQLRKEQGQAFTKFREKARKGLIEIDGNLQPILEKLESKPPQKSDPEKQQDSKLPEGDQECSTDWPGELDMPAMPEIDMPESDTPEFDQGY